MPTNELLPADRVNGAPSDDGLTDDAFLGGTLSILQPRAGFRAGIDAVLLAAAAPVAPGAAARVLDVGAGVGTVGLCVARRCPEAFVALIERERELADIARENVWRNALGERVTVAALDVDQVSAVELVQGALEADSFDHVLTNPPFHIRGKGTEAPNRLKAQAHAMPESGLDRWMRFLARMTRPGGTATIIHKAEALANVLAAFDGRFGALRVLPVHARHDQPAIRVLLQGIKGSLAPTTLLPQLTLHGDGNGFLPAAEDILKRGAALAL